MGPPANGEEMARCSICGEEHPLATMVTSHKEPEDPPKGRDPAFPAPVDWWLENAEAMNARHPRSFFIPPRARRTAMRPGELVRLGFIYGPHADRQGEGHVERMWVEVVEQGHGGHTRGRLRNRPARLTGVEIGDLVAFEAENVLGIDYSDEELGYAQDQWPVIDKAILADDRAPDMVIRAPGPYAEGEDEWWMLCRDNPAGPASESVGMLTDRFPGLEEPLRAGSGAWLLDGGQGESARWRRVADEEIAGSREWQSVLSWLEATAREMRGAD